MNQTSDPLLQALAGARQALQRGDRREARRWAEHAAALAPENEEPWLLLAAIASPRASLAYLQRALEINPHSQRARRGMHWAIQRTRASQASVRQSPTARPKGKMPPVSPKRTAIWMAAGFFGLIGFLGLAAVLVSGSAWLAQVTALPNSPLPSAQPTAVQLVLLSASTASPFPPATNTATPTVTPSATLTALPTATSSQTATTTPLASATSQPTLATNGAALPSGVGPDEFWVEVDLSAQRLYAHRGPELLETFIISSGKKGTPTVTGTFRIYVKYSSAPMSGPGYYLPGVPYIMYFYKDYGLHGTYWHNNFGTPMSHGCVNLKTENAKWLYKRARVGTRVIIHR